jgi:hypothetical protein
VAKSRVEAVHRHPGDFVQEILCFHLAPWKTLENTVKDASNHGFFLCIKNHEIVMVLVGIQERMEI